MSRLSRSDRSADATPVTVANRQLGGAFVPETQERSSVPPGVPPPSRSPCDEPRFPLRSRYRRRAANRARDAVPCTLVISPEFASVPLASRGALVAGHH
jgi:hypothetical protein